MKPVIIESPFRGEDGDYEAASLYLDYCIRDCLSRQETPYASHRMLPGALRDEVPEERALGIQAGLAMSVELIRSIDATVAMYLDLGESLGMTQACCTYAAMGARGATVETRRLPPEDFAAYQRELARKRWIAPHQMMGAGLCELCGKGPSHESHKYTTEEIIAGKADL